MTIFSGKRRPSEFLPFPEDHYADGPLNSYRDNFTADVLYAPLGTRHSDELQRLHEDPESLLMARGSRQEELFAAAREVREQYLGNKIKVRGVVEVSNSCTKECGYCAMRCLNQGLNRYTLTKDEIMEAAERIVNTGITTVFL